MHPDFFTQHPLPWHPVKAELKATRTCHHPSVTWRIVDAHNRPVYYTAQVLEFLCTTVNATTATHATP